MNCPENSFNFSNCSAEFCCAVGATARQAFPEIRDWTYSENVPSDKTINIDEYFEYQNNSCISRRPPIKKAKCSVCGEIIGRFDEEEVFFLICPM